MYRINLTYCPTQDILYEAGDAAFPCGIQVPTKYMFFYPRVHIPNGISIGSAVLAQLMAVTNIQTDRDHETSVTKGRIFALGEYDVA